VLRNTAPFELFVSDASVLRAMLGGSNHLWFAVRFGGRRLGPESLECFGQLVDQRDMREHRLLTHELAVVGVPERGIKCEGGMQWGGFWPGTQFSETVLSHRNGCEGQTVGGTPGTTSALSCSFLPPEVRDPHRGVRERG
jgi:hypothetical protein